MKDHNVNVSVTVTRDERRHGHGGGAQPRVEHTLSLGTDSGNPRFDAWSAHQLLLRLSWEAASQLGDPTDNAHGAPGWTVPAVDPAARLREVLPRVIRDVHDNAPETARALERCGIVGGSPGLAVLRPATPSDRDVLTDMSEILSAALDLRAPLPGTVSWVLAFTADTGTDTTPV